MLLLPKSEFHEMKTRMAGRKESFFFFFCPCCVHSVFDYISYFFAKLFVFFFSFQGKLRKDSNTGLMSSSSSLASPALSQETRGQGRAAALCGEGP